MHHGFLSGPPSGVPAPVITVSNINPASIGGSFVISTWTLKDGKESLLGTEPILSRWHASGCQNCQSHPEVRAHTPLMVWAKEDA